MSDAHRTEAARLQRLADLRVTAWPEEDLDAVVALAAEVAGVPAALIGLVDDSCQWYKAKVGVEPDSVPRELAVCELVVQSGAAVVIEDMSRDPRTQDHPAVTGEAHVRFYAGFPLVGVDGLVVGTLCLFDTEPRGLSERQHGALAALARQVMGMLELRQALAVRDAELAHAAEVEEELAQSRRQYELLALHSSDVVSRHDATGRVTYVSPSLEQVLGHRPEDELGESAVDHVHEQDRPVLHRALARVAQGERVTVVVRSQHARGDWRHMEITLSPLLDEDGELLEVYSASRDVTERVVADQERQDALELKRAVMAAIPVGIVSCTADGRLRLFNSTARDFHGIGPDVELGNEDWAQHYSLFRADGRTPLEVHEVPLLRALTGEEVEDLEMVIAPRGLPSRLVSCTGRQLIGRAGEVTGAVVSMTDITALRVSETGLREAHEAAQHANQRLAESERQFRDIFESGPLAIAQLDADGGVLRANPALRRLLGRTTRDITERGLVRLVVAADRPAFSVAVVAASTGTPHDGLELRLVRSSGTPFWCEIALSPGLDHDGRRTVLVQIADVDERKRHELALEHQASRDELTGLLNRTALQHELQQQQGQEQLRVAMLFLDVDSFKAINDTHGHHVGDEVLVAVAQRLQHLVRPTERVARLGGDEFVVLHVDAGVDDPVDAAALLVTRIRDRFLEAVITSVGPLVVRLSVGLAHAGDQDELDDLMRRADRAMYADKPGASRVVPAEVALPR